MKQYNNGTIRRGFTLIELLVTLGIIMMMLAVGLPYFRDFEKRNQLDGAAQLLRDGILTAKSLSLAPSVDKEPGADAYAVSFATGQNNFRISECKPELTGTNCAYNLKTTNFPSNISIDAVTPVDSLIIAFSITGAGRISNISGTANPVSIILTHTGLTHSDDRIITINTQTGLIKIQ